MPPRSASPRRGLLSPTHPAVLPPVLLFLSLLLSSPGRAAESDPPPLSRAHAHNDYEHARPLLDALGQGFCSVEADIFLVDGRLLVAHSRPQVKPERTLEALYLDPLAARVQANGGRVFRDGPPFSLLIDFKTDAATTWAALQPVLERFRPMLTEFGPDFTRTNAVTVVLSGNSPRSQLAPAPSRLAAIDGRPADLDLNPSVHLVPWISEAWGTLFTWRGGGDLPETERQRLTQFISRAHSQGRRVRFWGAPDQLPVWKLHREAGVDLLNTDKLAELAAFLNGATATTAPAPATPAATTAAPAPAEAPSATSATSVAPGTLPVRGLCIAAPRPSGVDAFVQFIAGELVPRAVNTLILRVDFQFQYRSRPELADPSGLSYADVARLVAACRTNGIRLIPQLNLLGHQSWERTTGRLLEVYPEFDETPWVAMPEKYVWPNPDGLYCRSYCSRHPGVHGVVLPLVDELCDVFEADAFHAGMDEVFYLGEAKCPRCGGQDRSVLFAEEVRRLRNHLHTRQRELWIWGDRLLDGRVTGLGEWEASFNDTHRAVDLIPTDVFICDWHYERPDPTPVYFAMKGFRVAICPWRQPEIGVRQVADMVRFRAQSAPAMAARFQGVVQTVWSDAAGFLRELAALKLDATPPADKLSAARCFVEVFEAVQTAAAPAAGR